MVRRDAVRITRVVLRLMPGLLPWCAATLALPLLCLAPADARAESFEQAPDAQPRYFDIRRQPLATALNEFAVQSQLQILFTPELTDGKVTRGVRGTLTAAAALRELLAGTGLAASRTANDMVLVGLAEGIDDPARPRTTPAERRRGPAEGAPASPPTSGNRDPMQLEDVLVTARKIVESVQSAPLTIHVFDPAELARGGQGGLLDVAQRTPGFVFQTYSSSFHASPTMRGISQFDITSPVANVSTVVDGIYLPRNYSVDLGIVDVARVEIAKGPQSTLYGSNAFAGVIAYSLARPGDRPMLEFGAVTGNAGRLDYKLAAGTPLLEGRAGLRVNYGRTQFAGTWRNLWPIAPGQDLGGRDNETWGATFDLRPTERITIGLDGFELRRHEDLKPAFNLTSNDPDSVLGCSPFICGTLSWNLVDYKPPTSQHLPGLAQPPQPGFHSRTRLLAAHVDVDLAEAWRLHYLYGWVDSFATESSTPTDDPLNPPTGINYNSYARTGCLQGAPTCNPDIGRWTTTNKEGSTNQLSSHELRLDWNRGPWSALLGAYYAHITDVYQFANGSIAPGAPLLDRADDPYDFVDFAYPLRGQLRRTRSLAAFGRVDREFAAGRANLALELRRQRDELGSVATRTGALLDAPAFALVAREATFSATTPRLTATWRSRPGSMVYVSAARGVKQGGFNPLASGGRPIPDAEQTFAPEDNWTFELGTKHSLLERRAILNADLFYVDWHDLQIRQQPSNAGNAIAPNITRNSGGASSRGLEVEAQLIASRGLQLGVAAAYVDSRFDAGEVSGQVLGLCDGVICPRDGAIGGRQLPRHSKLQAAAMFSWSRMLSPRLAGRVRGELTYQSAQQVDEANIAQVPSRSLVNLSAGIYAGDWDLSVWGRNVFDRRYVADAYYIPAASLRAVAYSPSLGERATWGLSFNLHLD